MNLERYPEFVSALKIFRFASAKKEAKLKTMTRKALISAAEEIEVNPRARSAKLRVARRV